MKFVKSHSYILLSLTLIAIFLLIFNTQKDFIFKDLTMAWNATHYAINYSEFGFIKRGFIGSVYNILTDRLSQEYLFYFQLSFILLFVAITHYFFLKKKLNNSYIYLLFILSPATLMQFSYDFGRFDPFLVSLFMLSILFKHNSILFISLSILGILTHEIYIFALLPTAFLIFLFEKKEITTIKEIIYKTLLMKEFYILIFSILLVLIFGKYEQGYEHIIENFSKSSLPSSYIEYFTQAGKGQSLNIWTRSILDNLIYTSTRLNFSLSTIYMIIVYLLMLIYFYLIGVDLKKTKYKIILLSSLPMFFLGTDWGRWLAFIYISIFIMYITTEKEKATNKSNKYLLLFSFYGPLGVGGYLSPFLSKFIALF